MVKSYNHWRPEGTKAFFVFLISKFNLQLWHQQPDFF